MYYTPLRKHMKELVDELIEDAIAEGFVTTRKKPGRVHQPAATMLDPMVRDHSPQYAPTHQRCQTCGKLTRWFCAGCAKADGGGPACGFYCVNYPHLCFTANHVKRARTAAPAT